MRPHFTLPLLLLFASAPAAVAHPLPNFRYDRELDVRLHPQTVEVRYVLLVSFWTIFTDSQKLFTPEEIQAMDGKMTRVMKAYCEKMGPIIAARMDAQLNGRKLVFRATKMVVEQDREHAKLRYVFEAPWRINGGGPDNEFAFEDHNFENDTGSIALKLPEDEVREEKRVLKLKESIEPEDLRRKDPSQYKPGDAERARRASAVFTAPALPPLEPDAPSAPVQTEAAPAAPVAVEEISQESGYRALLERGPRALFDTNFGTGTLLLLAAVFGAFHAFAPGHGKSVAAAFLVGEQGTFRQAILLGLSTTFAHTGSVILIAGVFYLRYRESVPQEAQQWLGLVGGLIVLFVGMWLFMRRLRGRVDHVHLFGGCADMCGNHAPPPAIPQCRVPVRTGETDAPRPMDAVRLVARRTPLSWMRVVLLGIGAGAIPCVDAVLLLMLAVSAGRLAFALPLLVSFSIGLSAVLALVGMFVVLLHRAGRRGFSESDWFRFLPTASAVLLMGMGLWMARDAWKGMGAVG
jgi:ABC-type nickel/cobalt efflux system permease component RcnA